MIRSIELRNWKTHKDTKLEFGRGTNILIGQMGAGKSSIMDAISFSLFGMFPAIRHRRVNVSKIIRNKPLQEQSAYVKLAMDIGGDEYRITRELGIDGKSTATIEKNGTYLQSQPQRVTEEVERILKVDYDLFSKAVYSEQNGLDYFLNLRTSERKKQIDGLLGLDKFATAQDNATTLVNRIRDMVADSERIIRDFDVVKAKGELEDIRTELDKLNAEKSTAESGIKKHSSEKSALEAEAARLKELNNRRNALSKEIEGAKSRIGLLESEIAKIDVTGYPGREKASSERKALQQQIEGLKSHEASTIDAERRSLSNMAGYEKDLVRLKKDHDEKTRIKKELGGKAGEHASKELEALDKLVETLLTERSHSISMISDTEIQLKELTAHSSKCPICETILTPELVAKIRTSKESLLAEHRSKSKALDSDISQKRSRRKELESLLKNIEFNEKRLKEYHDTDDKLKSLETELSRSRSGYAKAKADREAAAKALLAANEMQQKLNSAIELIERRDRHISEKSRLSSSLSEKSKEYDGIKVDEKSLDRMQAELVKANAEISRHTANLSSTTKYIKDKESQAKSKESEIARITALNDGLAKKKALVDNLSKFKTALSETQTVLRSQLVTTINDIMAEIWTHLYPYGDYRGIVLDAAEDDYGLRLKALSDNKYVWEDVESVASGGERSTACLAMRIAFSLVLVPNLKWLILDEPTHNIDREGLAKFVQMFSETLPSIVDQVFIITHDDMLKQVSNARIYVLSRNKEENRETEVAVA